MLAPVYQLSALLTIAAALGILGDVRHRHSHDRPVAADASQQGTRCDESRTAERAYRLTSSVLRQTGNGGRNVSARIDKCEYFARDRASIITMTISWLGPLTDEYYEMYGRLTLTDRDWRWAKTGGNDNLLGWEIAKSLAAVAATAASAPPAEQQFDSRFCIRNTTASSIAFVVLSGGAGRLATTVNIAPGSTQSLNATPADTLWVVLDHSLTAGLQEKRYRLMNAKPARDCASAPAYRFERRADSLVLFAPPT